MPKKPDDEQSGSQNARARRRIQWKPSGTSDGTEPEPRIDIELEAKKSNSENDDRLQADKPPHWG